MDPVTGKDVWSAPFAARSSNDAASNVPTVTAAGGLVYLTDMHDGFLHAYDTSGTWHWSYPGKQSPAPAGSPAFRFIRNVAVVAGTVFSADATTVRAFDTTSGKPLWAKPYTAASGLQAGPIAVGGKVFAEAQTPTGSLGPLTLVSLDPVTGQPGYQDGVPLNPQATDPDFLAADHDTLYVVSADKHVMAYRPSQTG
jgi:outer membrane protein assembly factor BamB